MCNLSKGVEEKGIQKGIEKGIQKGIDRELRREFFFQLETLWKQWGGQ
ncbi:hypothetical protein [Blautia argi]|nr:hypothetical protein [Blautia argi]